MDPNFSDERQFMSIVAVFGIRLDERDLSAASHANRPEADRKANTLAFQVIQLARVCPNDFVSIRIHPKWRSSDTFTAQTSQPVGEPISLQMPGRWSGDGLVRGESDMAKLLLKELFNPTAKLPDAIVWHRALSMAQGLGRVAGVLKDLGDAVVNVLKENAYRLLTNGWDLIAVTLIRVAAFIQDLALKDEDQDYTHALGYRNNEFGKLVTGFLEMVALAQYTKRVMIPSADFHRDDATGKAREMWTALSVLMGLEIDSMIRRTALWVQENVREL